MAAAKHKIEQWSIDRVLPYAQNAKVHPSEQIARLAESIKEFGFVIPVVVDKDGTLIAGHGRIEAANTLGMKTVPVIRVTHLTEAQVVAFRLADNSIPLDGHWAPDIVTAELAKLEDMNFDLSPLGLDAIQLPDLEELESPTPSKRNKTKTTLFISVKNADAAKARQVCAAAMNKAKIEHNL